MFLPSPSVYSISISMLIVVPGLLDSLCQSKKWNDILLELRFGHIFACLEVKCKTCHKAGVVQRAPQNKSLAWLWEHSGGSWFALPWVGDIGGIGLMIHLFCGGRRVSKDVCQTDRVHRRCLDQPPAAPTPPPSSKWGNSCTHYNYMLSINTRLLVNCLGGCR